MEARTKRRLNKNLQGFKDIQLEEAKDKIDIDQVGVRGVKCPLIVRDRQKKVQHTVAEVSMSVNLPYKYRGTHMSRFLEVLQEHNINLDLYQIKELLGALKEKLNAQASHIEISFPFFLMKEAPVSKSPSFMEYKCRYFGHLDRENRFDHIIEVLVPVMSMCPCSKELCKYSAHSQRGVVRVRVSAKKLIWIEEIIEIVESSASSPLFSLLKREDEKFVTENAFENARFAEDIVREVAVKLENLVADRELIGFIVEAENFESIHNHNAFALVKKGSLNLLEHR